MQIKTTISLHTYQKIKNSDDIKCWQGYGETGSLIYCWWKHKMVQSLWKSLAVTLKKKKTKHVITIILLYDTAITCLGMYAREIKSKSQEMESVQRTFDR